MAKTIGAKDRSTGRVRSETEGEISARVAKTAKTRKANKRKDEAERAATSHRKQGFFDKRVRRSADEPANASDEDRLDEAASTENDGGAGAGLPSVDLSQVTVSRGAASINTSSAAIQSLIGNNGSSAAVSIDAEWRILKNSHGYIVGPDKMAVIIVAYSDPEGNTVRVHIFQVYEFKGRSLPVQLMNLITDERIKKVGVNVGGDLAKIGRWRSRRTHAESHRARRTCQNCKRHNGAMYATCKGKGPRGKCEFYVEDGRPK